MAGEVLFGLWCPFKLILSKRYNHGRHTVPIHGNDGLCGLECGDAWRGGGAGTSLGCVRHRRGVCDVHDDIGQAPGDGGGKVTFTGKDPLVSSHFHIGATMAIPAMAAGVGAAAV